MEIIIKPVLTEKMTIQGEKLNRYGFIVYLGMDKSERKQSRKLYPFYELLGKLEIESSE